MKSRYNRINKMNFNGTSPTLIFNRFWNFFILMFLELIFGKELTEKAVKTVYREQIIKNQFSHTNE